MREGRVPLPEEGRERVWIAHVAPRIDSGRVAVKRCVGDVLELAVDLVCDGHDRATGVARVKRPDQSSCEIALEPEPNDRFRAHIALDAIGTWEIGIEAWVDPTESMRSALVCKLEANVLTETDLRAFAELLRRIAENADEDAEA